MMKLNGLREKIVTIGRLRTRKKHPHDSGRLRRHGDHARGWRLQDHGLALAGVFRRSRCRRPRGKTPQTVREETYQRSDQTQGRREDRERAARQRHALERADLAKEMGISHTSVQRIWAEHDLKPHLVKRFKVSTDPNFAVKVDDIIGLYLDPPEGALVLAIDEKSQIQALDRTQPGLPLKKGRAGTMTHDYKRNGTTTLFAALDIATGKVIGECLARHRADEFLAFLKKIDRETPARLDLHLILDNYATHKTPAVKRWLARHKRFIPHFTPTSCSWLNLVERLFAEITRQRIRRGIFHDVAELKAAIDEWIEHRNQNPKPFTWTVVGVDVLFLQQFA
jgi:transposase/DNA-binding XRE family transcriptional regulator